MGSVERRTYIRHPSDIPITYTAVDLGQPQQNCLKDISMGGLSFRSQVYFEKGTVLWVQIALVHPAFQGQAVVVWCRENQGYYEIGVQFVDEDTRFRARMVEQICHIEQYKRQVLKQENRRLSGEEAAQEWIRKYAKDFPD